MKKMYEKKDVRFFVYVNLNGNYTVYVFPKGKNDFSVFFHTKEQVINFINETEYDDIN